MTIDVDSTSPRREVALPLYDLTMAVAAAKRPEDIFEAALTCLRDSINVERSSVLLFDPDRVMRFKAWRGLSDGYRAAVEGHSPWTPGTTDAAPVLVEDAWSDPELASLLPVLEAEGIRALAFVPLTLGEKLLGKFMLYYGEPHEFDEFEVMTAQTIAAHVAFAIDQQAHRLSDLRYRDLLRGVGVAVYATDVSGRITFFNDEAVALWGRTPEIGVDLCCGSFRLFDADGTPMAHEDCPMAVALREGIEVRGREAIAERPDGTRVNFIPYPTPVFDDAGKLSGAINVMVDITPRKRAETALVEKEERLIAALGEKDEVLATRAETIRLYEAVQAQLASLVEASGALVDTSDRTTGLNTILSIASRLLSADAYAVWHFVESRDAWEIASSYGLSADYLAVAPVTDHRGQRQVEGHLVIEDVHAAPELASLHERYRREGICSMFVAPLSMAGECHGSMTFYYRSPHAFSELEIRVALALANLASASLLTRQLFEDNEESRRALTAANDDLERVVDDLRIANGAKDEFLSLVSHELRTPLTTIRGGAEVLARQSEIDPDVLRNVLDDIVAEAKRLHRIIENLLLIARSEHGEGLDAEPLLIIRVVERIVARHRRQNATRTYEIVSDGDPRPIEFSEAALEQVIENLLSNAEKYSPPHEPIVIEFERLSDEVRMRVLDRGPGITREDAERLFEPFYRSASTTGRAQGIGIGLAVCKRLIEAQAGVIWAQPRDGGGAEFGFALPIAEGAELA